MIRAERWFRVVVTGVVVLSVTVTGGPIFFSAGAAEAPISDLYEPKQGDFKPYYKADAENRQRQPFSGEVVEGAPVPYWTWVERFYAGYGFNMGWYQVDARVMETMTDVSARRLSRELLNELGRLIAREWAKDNDVRNINSAQFFRWEQQLKTLAAENDPQNAILAHLQVILDQVKQAQHPGFESPAPEGEVAEPPAPESPAVESTAGGATSGP